MKSVMLMRAIIPSFPSSPSACTCEPCWLSIEHQLFTDSGQSNRPASPISAIPHFLYPSFGKSCLQVSGQGGLIQMLKARNFRAGHWLYSANCYEQSKLCRADSERSKFIVANSRDCLGEQARA
jgi:hypothetical protein